MGLLSKIFSILFGSPKGEVDPQRRKEIDAKAHAFDLVIKEMGDGKPIPKRKNKPIRAYGQESIDVDLAGIYYRPDVYKKVRHGDELEIRPEPTNPYDKNALAVYLKGELLGYIPRNQRRIIKSFRESKQYTCTVYSKYSKSVVARVTFS